MLYYRDGNSQYQGLKAHVGLKPESKYDNITTINRAKYIELWRRVRILKQQKNQEKIELEDMDEILEKLNEFEFEDDESTGQKPHRGNKQSLLQVDKSDEEENQLQLSEESMDEN